MKARKYHPITQAQHTQRSIGADRLDALRDGRRNRTTTFAASKGKGSYRRTTKHRETYA